MPKQNRLVLRLALVAIVVAAVYLGGIDARLLLQVFPLALLTGVGIGLLIFSFRLKKLLTAAYSPVKPQSVRLEEVKDLSSEEIERLTREWERLGFVQRGDFITSTQVDTIFFRCLEHENEGALAQVTHQIVMGKPTSFLSSVTSAWGDENADRMVERYTNEVEHSMPVGAPLASPTSNTKGTLENSLDINQLPLWMLVTHNHAPSRFAPLLRDPRLLGERLPKESSPAQIWQAHLERRRLVEAKLHKPLLRRDLLSLVKDAGLLARVLIVKRLGATSPWKLVPYRFARDAKVPALYDGELAPLDS